jgi:two-component system NtrC family sensor kinase
MCLPHLDRGPVDAAEVLEKTLGAGEALRHCGTQRFQSEYTVDQRTIQLSLKQVGPENAAAGKILVLSDSTDRNLAEYALRTADKIAATARLAHAIAHEINNPLEALTNLLYLARTSSSMDSIQNLILQATAEVDRIARITRQTLSFHRDTQFPQVLDVGELVSDVASVLQNSATARHVRVECDCRPTLAINGFPGQLRQIFNNLIRNAAEAAPEGTVVVVRVRSISRGGRAGTRVTIHDRGRGIPAEVRRQIFDPFSTTKELKGSGLGLWVSRNLIMRHNGTIRFRTSTREGASGTIFEVFLPVGGMSSDGSPPGEQNAQPSFRSKRIQEWISAE